MQEAILIPFVRIVVPTREDLEVVRGWGVWLGVKGLGVIVVQYHVQVNIGRAYPEALGNILIQKSVLLIDPLGRKDEALATLDESEKQYKKVYDADNEIFRDIKGLRDWTESK